MRNTVLFPGVISPITVGRASVGRRRAGSGAQREARSASSCSATRRTTTCSPRPVLGRHRRPGRALHHRRRRRAPPRGAGTERASACSSSSPAGRSSSRACRWFRPTDGAERPEIEARFLQLKEQAVEAIRLLPNAPEELGDGGAGHDLARRCSPTWSPTCSTSRTRTSRTCSRPSTSSGASTRCSSTLGERVGVLRISKEIGDKTKKEFDERQREHVLREQMRQIQKELGEGEDTAAELEELKKAIDDAGMPEDTHKHAVKELKRLQRMGEGSAEGSMLRTYLEWLAELPWKDGAVAGNRHRESEADPRRGPLRPRQDQAPHPRAPRGAQAQPARARARSCASSARPGVGKTSLGQSIARATGRKFQRIALGGVHDEAEIRGHRRTYIGALPGNIIQAIRRAESRTLRADVRRDRQARPGRLPRRPVERAARGARPGAELEIPRQLPRRGLRPVEGDVHHHRERARHHPRAAARPHGDHPASRLHRGGEAARSPSATW